MKRFKNILFVTDSEQEGGYAFDRAVALAENNQARLTIVSILDEFPTEYRQKIYGISLTGLNDTIMDNRRLQLENLLASIKQKIQVDTKILTGTSFLVLIQEVLRHKRDLLIKAATVENTGFMDRFIVSTDMHLLRKCPCPVWLVKSPKSGDCRKIMAALDIDSSRNKSTNDILNQQILEMSTSLALSGFGELHIIHAWHAYGESSLRSGFARQSEADIEAYVDEMHVKYQHLLYKLVDKFIDQAGQDVSDYLKPKIHLVKGFARDVIPEMVKKYQINLIMMGTVGRTGIPGYLMGNTAETILNRVDCSVVAMKPEGFVTPVIP